MSKYLNRDAILKSSAFPAEDVDVPEWGGTVRVQALSGAQRDAYEGSMVDQRGKDRKLNMDNIRAKLVSLSVVDEKGARVFTSADVAALGAMNAAPLDRVFAVAQRLSGLTKGDVEELAGNSVPGQSGNSISD